MKYAFRLPIAFIAATALVVAVGGVNSRPALARTSTPCLKMAKLVSINGAKTQVCEQLYRSAAGIRLPNDTREVAFGMLNTLGTATFITRTNKSLPVKPGLLPKTPNVGVGGLKSFAQIIYQASLKRGKITRLKPALFVPVTTPLLAYRNQTFIGDVTNLLPDADVPQTDFVRMDFGGTFTPEGALKGSFANLTRSVRRNQLVEPPAPCEAALLGTDTARNDWYIKIFGSNPEIKLVWDPAMHTPLDSELVVYVGGSIGYMTHSPTLLELMKRHIDTAATKQFMIHGNPMGTPANFTGAFQPSFPLRTCM